MPESAAPVDTSTAGIAGDAEGEKEREAKEILPYILLHRSRSHHFDLRAELAEWRKQVRAVMPAKNPDFDKESDGRKPKNLERTQN